MSNPTGKGGYVKGQPAANPMGRPKAVMQDFPTRLGYWLTNKTVGEINDLLRQPKEWNKLPAIDAIVIRRIWAALQKKGSTQDFIAVLDRYIGKPVQPIAAEVKVTHGLAERIEAARNRLLAADALVITNADTPAAALAQQLEARPVAGGLAQLAADTDDYATVTQAIDTIDDFI